MKFLRCGGKICMNNNDVENNYNGEEEPSRNVMEENTLESSEERRSDEAKAHGWWLLPKKTYDSIKENKAEYDWREIDDESIKQERPRGNTVLHIAALYGNDKCVEKVLQIDPLLLRKRNTSDDTPLHVAARAGNISTLEKLVDAFLRHFFPKEAILLTITNKQGNTFFHEALQNGHKDVMKILDSSQDFKQLAEETAFTRKNRRGKSVLHLAIEKGYQDIVYDLLTRVIPLYADILQNIVNNKKEWIHVKDHKQRNALHHAASIGYLDGAQLLLKSCDTCHMETDKDGLFPLHLASACGHSKVVKQLLEICPNPKEIVDKKGRNIAHIAAIMGQFNVIRDILQSAKDEVKDMINDKDYGGNTPLHLAASHCHPKVVQALTWDRKVNLNGLNDKNQTALDAFEQFKQEDNPPFTQRLTWCLLKSAGVQNAKRGLHTIEIPSPCKPEPKSTKFYKDRINTLMVVSTLITTVAFAAGFTLPGGTNSSTPEQGMAVMLHHVWFKPFIFCITASMYGGISVTIILIWAQLGDINLALFALNVATPLLGVTLATLSVAFLAGVYLVISDLSWLATTIMILCVIFVLMLLLLYILLWLPSASSNLILRRISYIPFKILTWLFEKSSTEDKNVEDPSEDLYEDDT